MAKKIRLKYHKNILEEIKKYRNQGFSGEIIIWN